MERVKTFFRNDRFAEYVGIELLEFSAGKAKARLKVQDKHLNAVNIVHGGAIYSLADLAFAVASNSHGTVAVAINGNISHLKAVTGGTLIAEAQEVGLNPKLATYEVKITDESGDTVALFQGTVYRKQEKVTENLS